MLRGERTPFVHSHGPSAATRLLSIDEMYVGQVQLAAIHDVEVAGAHGFKPRKHRSGIEPPPTISLVNLSAAEYHSLCKGNGDRLFGDVERATQFEEKRLRRKRRVDLLLDFLLSRYAGNCWRWRHRWHERTHQRRTNCDAVSEAFIGETFDCDEIADGYGAGAGIESQSRMKEIATSLAVEAIAIARHLLHVHGSRSSNTARSVSKPTPGCVLQVDSFKVASSRGRSISQ